jgi:hypothetical protein
MIKILAVLVHNTLADNSYSQIPPVGVNIKPLGSEVGFEPPSLDTWLSYQLLSYS